jgi:hypothetical protein
VSVIEPSSYIQRKREREGERREKERESERAKREKQEEQTNLEYVELEVKRISNMSSSKYKKNKRISNMSSSNYKKNKRISNLSSSNLNLNQESLTKVRFSDYISDHIGPHTDALLSVYAHLCVDRSGVLDIYKKVSMKWALPDDVIERFLDNTLKSGRKNREKAYREEEKEKE